MILSINTTEDNNIDIKILDGKKIAAQKKFPAARMQAELLLPAIDKLLKNKKFSLKKIDKIKIANAGGSFTALRIGVVTANALAYALGVKIEGDASDDVKALNGIFIVEPKYSGEPVITKKKDK